MTGVSFQPGADDRENQQNGNGSQRPSGGGVQEAIRILSLRLPRVLGAQAASSLPLLTSQGSGGNPRVDAIVNQVMSRMPPAQAQAGGPPAMPTFGGQPVPDYAPIMASLHRAPRFEFGNQGQPPPPPSGGRWPDGRSPAEQAGGRREAPSIDRVPQPPMPPPPMPPEQDAMMPAFKPKRTDPPVYSDPIDFGAPMF